MPGESSEWVWMLSKHCEMSLIHASLSWAVGATKWIQSLWPDLPSIKILKSRLFALTGSAALSVLLCADDAEQSDSSSSFACSLGSSIKVASTSGILPTSGSRWSRPFDVLNGAEKDSHYKIENIDLIFFKVYASQNSPCGNNHMIREEKTLPNIFTIRFEWC